MSKNLHAYLKRDENVNRAEDAEAEMVAGLPKKGPSLIGSKERGVHPFKTGL